MTTTPLEVLKKYFGYDSFRNPQEETITSVLSGKDTLTLAATGTGKALHKDTVLQQPDGLTTTMGAVKEGMFVVGKDGKPTKVVAKFQPKTPDHYLISFEDGTQVKACGDHLWLISKDQDKDSIFNTRVLYSLLQKGKVLEINPANVGKPRLPHRIVGIDSIQDNKEDYYCISVDNEDHLYLITDKNIPTHNTAMFQVPAMCLDGLTIVISPLKALQKDQVDNCKAKGIPVALINSDTGKRDRAKLIKELTEKTLKILYVSPETLFGDNFADILPLLDNVKLLAIDEAHCCSAWSDFRPKYREIYKAREEFFPDAVILAVTATADQKVQEDIVKYIGLNRDHAVFKTTFDRPTIEYQIIPTANIQSPLRYAAKIINKYHKDEPGIIFCGTQKKAEESATFLKALGMRVKHYHSKIKKSEKEEIQDQYLKGELDLICATIAFGMGIDKAGIRYVIHLDAPSNFDDYSQQVGRASRDLKPSKAYLLYDQSSYNSSLWLMKKSTTNPERLKVKTKKLQEFHNFCKSNVCRRRTMLAYFGETYGKTNCGSCDVCKGRIVV